MPKSWALYSGLRLIKIQFMLALMLSLQYNLSKLAVTFNSASYSFFTESISRMHDTSWCKLLLKGGVWKHHLVGLKDYAGLHSGEPALPADLPFPPVFFGSNIEWMFGSTPPLAIVTCPSSLLSSSSFLTASWIWRGTILVFLLSLDAFPANSNTWNQPEEEQSNQLTYWRKFPKEA